MRTLAILKNGFLTLLLTFAASGVVNANLASGPQNLALDPHQAGSWLEAAPRLGWSGSSYAAAPESPVVRNSGHSVRGERGRFASNEAVMRRSGRLPLIQTTQLVDPSVAAARSAMQRVSPIIHGGDLARTPPRTRAGGAVEKVLRTIDRLNEDAEVRNTIRDVLEHLSEVQ